MALSPSTASARHLALVMSHMRHGIVVIDRAETIVLINAEVSRIFNLPQRAVAVGSSLSDYLIRIGHQVGWSPERTANVIGNHRLWKASGVTRTIDHHFDDGKVFEITFDPVDADTSVLTYVDVTHERQLQRTGIARDELTRQASEMIEILSRISSRNRAIAFNASIEAARLGDQGRGFAAVAAEVRDLSRQMSDALADIGRVIASSLAA